MNTDTCPECLRPWNPPLLVLPVDDGTEETYRCSRCGHEWWCSWGPRGTHLPEAAEDPDAWEVDDDFTDYDRDCWP